MVPRASLALALALLVFLPLTVPAPAEAKAPAAWERKALNIAHGYWQKRRPGSNCKPKQVKIKTVKALSGGAWGMAPIAACRFLKPKGKTTIKLVSHADRYGWRMYCTLVVHEWGHLVGLNHVPGKNKLMSRVVTGNALLKECRGKS